MSIENFTFLQPNREVLAKLGFFAEQYAYTDPGSALVKLRMFAERVVYSLFEEMGLPQSPDTNLFELLQDPSLKASVPILVLNRLHAIRKTGNAAVHGGPCKTEDALWCLEQAYGLATWLHVARDKGDIKDCGTYSEPPQVKLPPTGDMRAEKNIIQKKLAEQERQVESLLEELEQARSQQQVAEKNTEELAVLLSKGQQVVDELQFNEADTRKYLIDKMIKNVGWDIDTNGGNTQEVTLEHEVEHQPTESGIGYADYVLWGDNGKPLAVIEAKKTSESKEKGKSQAKYYAKGLEKMYGQRPVIFCTNGYEIIMWDDAQGTPRDVFGFYSKDSLEYIHFQRKNKDKLADVKIDTSITDRLYQIQAIKSITERFSSKHRKSLIVLATGTGKTRIAVSLSDVLVRAKWAKRILFLCDRRELRKQAGNTFKEHLEHMPKVNVTAATAKDRDKRIYLATYPAMIKCFESFDVGFFDLIIADESHRSIYNRYRTLLTYFDALQIGLTATPVDMINRNTFRLFECESLDATFSYSYDDALREKFLAPFRVETFTTGLLRDGIKYENLTQEQRDALEEDGIEPTELDYEASQLDKTIFNKDTNRKILRNLMENGLREATGSHPGKTIVFARNHKHAVLLENLFNEMYPQYKGELCRVIDNYDPRAQQLIDDFKSPENPLAIAVSIDMLDTGIDIPEVVNLVFAKPVRSHVKFWQMIGRGTRLCHNLFGYSKHKEEFLIFDHWGNFKWFDMEFKKPKPNQKKSLLEQLFESRIILADDAQSNLKMDFFQMAIERLHADIKDLPERSIPVREKYRHVKLTGNIETLRNFADQTKEVLRGDIAPLMQWRQVGKDTEAYRFDLLITQLQTEFLRGSATYENLQGTLQNQLEELRTNLTQVQSKAQIINKVKGSKFWENPSVQDFEQVRKELRGIMQFRVRQTTPSFDPRVVDIAENEDDIKSDAYTPKKLEAMEMTVYRDRVEKALKGLFESNSTLKKIKGGQKVTERDLTELQKLVMVQNPLVDINHLQEFFPDTMGHLDLAIRRIIGLDADYVEQQFASFAQKHNLTSRQTNFLRMLKNHIRLYGAIEIDLLYEAPFTTLHSDGIDGVFQEEKQVDHIINILDKFRPPEPPSRQPRVYV